MIRRSLEAEALAWQLRLDGERHGVHAAETLAERWWQAAMTQRSAERAAKGGAS